MEKPQIIDYEIEFIADDGDVYEAGDCMWASDFIEEYYECLNEDDPEALHRADFDGWSQPAIIDFICEVWGIALKETGDIKVQYEQRTYHTHKDIYRCDRR